MSLKNDLILRAANGQIVERTPVWLMRQAGRILPEYRKIRNSLTGFKELVSTPELAAEVTIQPVDLLEVDAAILFSDILVVPQAMGLDYEMVEKKGPYFPSTIQTTDDLQQISLLTPDKVDFVTKAIQLIKKELNDRVPLIGFAGAPWTIFAYMVEGSGSKTFSKARSMLYSNPSLANKLLKSITTSTITYLKSQIKAGVDMIQIFDSWAGILPTEQYQHFSLQYIQEICKSIGKEVPITIFAKGAWGSYNDINQLSCNTIGIDWNTDPQLAKSFFKQKTLQGNLDPCALFGTKDTIQKETKKMLDQFQGHPHIANLGHGVYPDTDPKHVKYFIDCVKNY